MLGEDETPMFLELPFDWFVLERWQTDFSELSRAQVQDRMGAEYAKLGFKGRRLFSMKAEMWSNGRRELLTPPRDISTVPQDLLPAQMRRVCRPGRGPQPILVRVDYSPDSQARFSQLANDVEDGVDALLGDEDNLIDDEQYCNIDGESLPALYAILPCLLDPSSPYFAETEQNAPFDSEELQTDLYMANVPEYPAEDRRVFQLANCFVADNEAMTTGLLLWLRVDEYGTPVLQERIRPSSVAEVLNVGYRRSLREWRARVASLR